MDSGGKISGWLANAVLLVTLTVLVSPVSGQPASTATAKTSPKIAGLIAKLDHREERIRYSAVKALSKIGLPAIPALIEHMKKDQRALFSDTPSAISGMGKAAVPALLIWIGSPK
jgi:hypothetical protein